MKKNLFILLFKVSVAGVLTGIFFHVKVLDYISKPLIMISIAGHFLLNSKNIDKNVVRFAVLAFAFSWFGDLFLMFGNEEMIYFMLGLFSFLVAQISYVFLFRQTIKLSGGEPFLPKHQTYLIGFLIYSVPIYMLLFNHLNISLKIAVLIYMLAIMAMSAMALNRYKTVSKTSFSFVFLGSVLFVISDTLIALHKFLLPIPSERLIVMPTYMAAQFLIMWGILKQFE